MIGHLCKLKSCQLILKREFLPIYVHTYIRIHTHLDSTMSPFHHGYFLKCANYIILDQMEFTKLLSLSLSKDVLLLRTYLLF